MTETGGSGDLAAAALDATPARRRVEEAEQAIVLERLARGGGATRWYVLRNAGDLDALALKVSPGSRVSLYFDGRFLVGGFGDDERRAVTEIIDRDGEAVLGAVGASNIEAEVEFPSSVSEAEEFAQAHAQETLVVGAFPAAEDDGIAAVTVDLPDADGVVRSQPH